MAEEEFESETAGGEEEGWCGKESKSAAKGDYSLGERLPAAAV